MLGMMLCAQLQQLQPLSCGSCFSNPESPWCHSQFQYERLRWECARTSGKASFRCVLALHNSDLFSRTTVQNIMKMKWYEDSQEIFLLGGFPRYWLFFLHFCIPKTLRVLSIASNWYVNDIVSWDVITYGHIFKFGHIWTV